MSATAWTLTIIVAVVGWSWTVQARMRRSRRELQRRVMIARIMDWD